MFGDQISESKALQVSQITRLSSDNWSIHLGCLEKDPETRNPWVFGENGGPEKKRLAPKPKGDLTRKVKGLKGFRKLSADKSSEIT